MPAFLFFPESEEQSWLVGQLVIPGYISEIAHVYLLLDIYNVFQSRFPITPQKSVASSTGRARVEEGCHHYRDGHLCCLLSISAC